jgi:hypothetical protein
MEQNRREGEEMYGDWSYYDNGAFDTEQGNRGYFGKDRSFSRLSTFEEAKESFHKLDRKGKRSLCLDVMGQGRIGVDLGSDLSLGWTYKRLNWPYLSGREVDTGDLFKKLSLEKLFTKLERRIADEGYNLNAVFFRGVLGFRMYSDNAYAVSYLYENVLRRLYKLANVGCKFYLCLELDENSWFEPSNPLPLMDLLRSLGFEISSSGNSDHILTKTKGLEELPSLRQINKNGDILIERLKRIK